MSVELISIVLCFSDKNLLKEFENNYSKIVGTEWEIQKTKELDKMLSWEKIQERHKLWLNAGTGIENRWNIIILGLTLAWNIFCVKNIKI